MQAKRLFKFCVLNLALLVSLTAVYGQYNNRKPKRGNSSRAPVLRTIDKVELLSIESRMGDIENIVATKMIEGQEAQKIADVWRGQGWNGYSAAACHQPPYAIKFYSKGKLILFATVCWDCHNMSFITPDIKKWVEFDVDSKESLKLKEIFQKAFPSENN
jgi:hypothetical protein